MFRGQDVYYREAIRIWFILAFQAGAINIAGFLACHRFVSHVTGFPTFFADDLSKGDLSEAFNILLVPIFFVLGTMLSAWHVDRRIERKKAPRYTLVFSLICFMLIFVLLVGQLGYFGVFGEPLLYKRDYALMAILCAVSGIQNAVITTASGYRVRTTHLSGITTDFGIGLVNLWTKRKDKVTFDSELTINFYRFGTIVSFTLGGVAGAFAFKSLNYTGFILPLCTAIFVWRDAELRQRKALSKQSVPGV
ncbi:MAG: YoaK family protein [Bdellovibrionota bacterium]